MRGMRNGVDGGASERGAAAQVNTHAWDTTQISSSANQLKGQSPKNEHPIQTCMMLKATWNNRCGHFELLLYGKRAERNFSLCSFGINSIIQVIFGGGGGLSVLSPARLCLANPTNNLSFSTPWGLDWRSLDYRSCIATVLAKDLNIYTLKPLFLKLSVMALHRVQTDPTNGNTSNILHLAVVLRMLETQPSCSHWPNTLVNVHFKEGEWKGKVCGWRQCELQNMPLAILMLRKHTHTSQHSNMVWNTHCCLYMFQREVIAGCLR